MIQFLLFLFFVFWANAQIIVNTTKEESENVIAETFEQLLSTLKSFKVSIWFLKNKRDLVSTTLKKLEVPVLLNSVEIPLKKGIETREPTQIILIFNEVSVERILQENLWNGFTNFFILTDDFKKMKNNFEHFWKFKVINVFQMIQKDQEIVFYSFLPYEKGSCGIGQPLIVDRFIFSRRSFVNKGFAFRDATRIKNMNQCPINISVVNVKPNILFDEDFMFSGTPHIKGTEGYLLSEVAKILNFNATFAIAKDGNGWGWINPSPRGSVGEVFTGKSDFAAGLMAPTVERYESLDVSLPYNGEECLSFGVPSGAAADTPNWIKLIFFEFTPIIWLLLLLSFFFIVFVFHVMNKLSITNKFPTGTDLFLNAFSSCLGLPIKIPNFLPLRISVSLWIIFTFVVTVTYKSLMGSKLTVANKDRNINTFYELLQSKLQLTGYNNMLRVLQNNSGEAVMQQMVDKFQVTNFDIDHAIDLIAAERKIAYIKHSSAFLYYSLINPEAKGNVHFIKDCILLYHPLIITKKHSPFTYRLNQIISRLMESGITKKWRAKYIYTVPPQKKPFSKLSKRHMYGVFCIWFCGSFISAFAFILELFVFFCSKEKKNIASLKK